MVCGAKRIRSLHFLSPLALSPHGGEGDKKDGCRTACEGGSLPIAGRSERHWGTVVSVEEGLQALRTGNSGGDESAVNHGNG